VEVIGGSGNNGGGNVSILGWDSSNQKYGGLINLIGSQVNINNDNTLSKTVTIYKTGANSPQQNLSINQDSIDVNNNFKISGVLVVPNSYATKSNGQFTNLPSVNGTGILLSGQEIFEKRHDFVTGNLYDYSYCGTAFKNSSINANVWTIRRLSINFAGTTVFNESVTNYSWTGRYLAPYN
jgi:hypothetical protein